MKSTMTSVLSGIGTAGPLGGKGKPIKTIDRSHSGSFSYQIIDSGVYVGNKSGLLMYPMKSIDELRQNHYDWARSALII